MQLGMPVVVMPHIELERVSHGRGLLFHGARSRPYELCATLAHWSPCTPMYAQRPSVTVKLSVRPNQSGCHIGESSSPFVQLALLCAS